MAGYQGFFMKGMASGLQSGLDFGTKLVQLRWQKKKQKEIDDLNAKMNESWSTIGQELVSLAEDGQLSEDDKLKIYTMTLAAPYEMQGLMGNLRSSLSQFKTKEFENQIEYVKSIYDYAQGITNISDIDALYESMRSQITDPHAKALYEVADKKLRHEAEQEPQEDVWGQAGKLPMDIRDKYLRAKGVDLPEADKKSNLAGAIDYLKKFPNITKIPIEQFEAFKKDAEKFYNVDLSNITQESLLKPEVTEEPTEPPPETVTTLMKWEGMFDMEAETGPKTEEEYDRRLDLLKQSGDDFTPQYTWKEGLIKEVKGIAKELKTITDKEDYDFLLDIYMRKLEEIKTKYPEVNLKQFKEFKERTKWQKFWGTGLK